MTKSNPERSLATSTMLDLIYRVARLGSRRLPPFLAVLPFLWVAGCATPSSTPTASPSVARDPALLRIGVFPKLPPVVFQSGQSLAGAEADLGRGLAEHLGRQPHFVSLSWEDLLPALLDDRIDIVMSGMSITDARLTRVDFCDPWLRAGQSALIRRSDYATLRYGLIAGTYRVGTQKGTTGQYFADQSLPSARKSTLATPAAGAKALVAKRIDAFVHDLPINLWLASEYESKGVIVLDLLFTSEYIAWAVRRDNPDLRAAANAYVSQIKTNGFLEATIRRWLPGYLDRANR